MEVAEGSATGQAPQSPTCVRGRWVTERAYAETFAISAQTLANWRYKDRLAGRTEPAPGYPQYRRFGRAIRYRLDC